MHDPWTSQAGLLGAVVPGEHRWYVTRVSSLALWSWRVPTLSAEVVKLTYFQEMQCMHANKCQSLAFLLVWFEHSEMFIENIWGPMTGKRPWVPSVWSEIWELALWAVGLGTITSLFHVLTYSLVCVHLKRGDCNPLQCPYCPFQCHTNPCGVLSPDHIWRKRHRLSLLGPLA